MLDFLIGGGEGGFALFEQIDGTFNFGREGVDGAVGRFELGNDVLNFA